MRIFWKFFLWRGKLSGRSVLRSEQVGAFWWGRASWRDGAMLIINNLYRGALLGTQVAIFSVCYEWRICSVWQVAWRGIDIWAIIHMSSSERCNLLPFFGRVVWGTTRREPRCDEPDRMSARWTCVNYWLWLSLTCVGNWVFIFTDLQRIADLFDLIMLRYVLGLANFHEWCAYQNWHERCPMAIARCGLVENQQLVIARDYRVISFYL